MPAETLAHDRLEALHAELVLERDRQPVQRTHNLPCVFEIVVNLFRASECAFDEDLSETVCLCNNVICVYVRYSGDDGLRTS